MEVGEGSFSEGLDVNAEDSELLATEIGPAAGKGTTSNIKLTPEQRGEEALPTNNGDVTTTRTVRSETDQPTPQQSVDGQLVEHWSPLLATATGGMLTTEQMTKLAEDAHEKAATAAKSVLDRTTAARMLNTQPLHDTVTSLWSDAYATGTMAANVSLRGPDSDWLDWTPGDNPHPALTDLGWRSVLAGSGQSLRGLDDTTLDGIGNVLDKGVAGGLSVDDLAAQLNGYLSDPARASMIAQTESARMLTTASMSTYRANGLTEYDLVISDGACDECYNAATGNPYSVYDATALVPLHPRCRCSVAPTEDAVVDLNAATSPDMALDPNSVTIDGEKVSVLGEDDKRGNAPAVTRDEWAQTAAQGKGIIDGLRANATPPTGLTDNLDAIKASTYSAVQESWGGATIDAHTGATLASDADKYAVTVKPAGVESVSTGENPTVEEWNAAVDEAMSRFGDTLASQQHMLGVFHDDDLKRVDLDPVVVVDTKKESEAIGAYTHNIGGAFNFADGNGYWPPYVEGLVKKSMGEKVKTHFKGIGEWYAQNQRLNAGPPDNSGLTDKHTALDPYTGIVPTTTKGGDDDV